MKRLFHSLACAAIVAVFATPLLSADKQFLSLALAAPSESLKSGAELHLRVTVTNTSNREITFITTLGPLPEDDSQYELTVRDEHGQPAPPSTYMRTRDKRLPIFDEGSRVGKTLKPGESFVDTVTVTRFFDLSRPGKYTISVSRENPPRQNLGEGKVKSNAVTVTVVPQ